MYADREISNRSGLKTSCKVKALLIVYLVRASRQHAITGRRDASTVSYAHTEKRTTYRSKDARPCIELTPKLMGFAWMHPCWRPRLTSARLLRFFGETPQTALSWYNVDPQLAPGHISGDGVFAGNHIIWQSVCCFQHPSKTCMLLPSGFWPLLTELLLSSTSCSAADNATPWRSPCRP
jgi:hypothetical protein